MFGFTDEEIAGYIEHLKAGTSFSEVVFVGLLLIYMSYLFFVKN